MKTILCRSGWWVPFVWIGVSLGHMQGAEESVLARLWDWTGTHEAAAAADLANTDGLDDALETLDRQLRTVELEKLIDARESLMLKKLTTDERLATAHAERSRLNSELYREYQSQKAANPGRSNWLNARNAEARTAHIEKLGMHRADSRSLAVMRVEAADDIANLQTATTKIARAEEGLAAGKSGSPFRSKGWLQAGAKFLDTIDLAGAAGRVAADAWGVVEGDSRLQDVLDRAGEEYAKRVTVAESAALGALAGGATGPIAPVASPVFAFASGQAASEIFDATVAQAMEERRQLRADARARRLYEVSPEELAWKRAELRAQAQRERADAILAKAREYEESMKHLENLRNDVQACYAKWDAEKRREQQSPGRVSGPGGAGISFTPDKAASPLPSDIEASVRGLQDVLGQNVPAGGPPPPLDPDIQAGVNDVTALVSNNKQPASHSDGKSSLVDLLADLRRQAAAEAGAALVTNLQEVARREAVAVGKVDEGQVRQPDEKSTSDIDEIMRRISREAIRAASDAVGKIPLN